MLVYQRVTISTTATGAQRQRPEAHGHLPADIFRAIAQEAKGTQDASVTGA
jgi:hypothetical protein